MKINSTKEEGLAVDIDETLSWTTIYWFKEMRDRFGNPEGLSAEELVKKYRYTHHVPYWQTDEANAWIEEKRHDDALQEKLPLIADANTTLNKIANIIPIVAYITARPESVKRGTQAWLRKHRFPQAPVICRPASVSVSESNKWKAQLIELLYPRVLGIIDDNSGLTQYLSTKYKGHIFLYNHKTGDPMRRVIPCENWQIVLLEVGKTFEKTKKHP